MSEKYENQTLGTVAADLEKKYSIRLFYEPSLDSLIVDVLLNDVSFESIADALANSTGINFIERNGMIIATGNFELQSFPVDFFQEKTQLVDVETYNNILDQLDRQNEEGQEESIEKKLFEIGDIGKRFQGDRATLTGYVKDVDSGEPVIGATVFRKEPMEGVITDPFGYFTFNLPKGRHEIFISSTGMKETRRQIQLYSDGSLEIDLQNDIISLNEVVVTGERSGVDNLQTGFAKLDIESLKQIPSVFGEPDVMKVALTLPGVQTVGEGAAGFNVRGGSADQNLILLGDVPVYNTNHLFGFFSVFNPDVIASANLYKSGIGANYGGRIASVFDVIMREGNKKKFTFQGGIGPVTGKLTVEGPIKQDTSSYLVSVRSTYSDWVFSLLDDPELRNSTASFSDVVTKVTHQIDENNQLIFSGYHSRDRFRLNSDSLYRYFNSNLSLRWRHKLSNQMSVLSSISYANYNYNIASEANAVNAFKMDYAVNHTSLKTEFNYFPKEKTSIRFGAMATLYDLKPGNRYAMGDSSLVTPLTLRKERGLESALYGGYEHEVNSRFSVYAGLRLTMFSSLGPGESYVYAPNFPREPEFITDTVSYGSRGIIKTYFGPELRLSGRYKLRDDLSIKFSYDRMTQYIHMLSNTVAISPTDTWRLSSADIKPQRGDQYSLGLYKTFSGTSLEFSAEGYYKRTKNMLEYKDGAELLLNEALETDVISAEGKAYGLELLLKKNSGQFTGWMSYTYSRSLIRANGEFKEETINAGEFYPSNFDKPHSFILISNYKINRRVNLTFGVNYSTGRPATFPLTKYEFKGRDVLLYTDRNQHRIPDYFRIDFGINFEGNHRVHKKVHGSWTISVYNLTGRANAYSVFFRSTEDGIKGYKMSVFSQPIPTITYNFKLK